MESRDKLSYDEPKQSDSDGKSGHEGENCGHACRRAGTEGTMEILLSAAAVLATVWIIVLWGSRYFGPQ